MHTIREITRLATMLVGRIAPRIRLGFVPATPWLRSPASIVARCAITLIVRLGTKYTIVCPSLSQATNEKKKVDKHSQPYAATGDGWTEWYRDHEEKKLAIQLEKEERVKLRKQQQGGKPVLAKIKKEKAIE